jgi:hypothetical protein
MPLVPASPAIGLPSMFLKKLIGFFDQNMLELFEIERI